LYSEFLQFLNNLFDRKNLVLTMSTGIEAIVVANPLIIEAQKWSGIPSWKPAERTSCCFAWE
jgi:hypothetical protein